MFTQLRQDITSRGQRIRHDIARTSSDIRHARDEYHLAKAERPRFVTRVGDLVARYHGVTLYRDRVERGRQAHSLVGVRATVSESADRRTDLGTVRDVCLTITGPDWEWTVPTAAVFSPRKVRAFAALINTHSAARSGNGPLLVGA